MLTIGKRITLTISRLTPQGAYLETLSGDILLPGKDLPEGTGVGDSLEVFIYLDSEDRLIATTRHPLACVGDFACLRVKDVGQFGAFLDWGLEKDLLVPFAEQPKRMARGERHIIRVYLDNTGRIAGSGYLGKYLEDAGTELKEGDEVDLLIQDFTDLGAKVIISNRYAGLLFKNELHGHHQRGDRLKGYVKKIRDDRKIDVTLKKPGDHELAAERETILRALSASQGFLPLTDKSPPEQISRTLRMSKKTFKKAVGGLYKDGLIVLTDEGVTLK